MLFLSRLGDKQFSSRSWVYKPNLTKTCLTLKSPQILSPDLLPCEFIKRSSPSPEGGLLQSNQAFKSTGIPLQPAAKTLLHVKIHYFGTHPEMSIHVFNLFLFKLKCISVVPFSPYQLQLHLLKRMP